MGRENGRGWVGARGERREGGRERGINREERQGKMWERGRKREKGRGRK